MDNKTLPITAYVTGPAAEVDRVLELLRIDRNGEIKGNQFLGHLIRTGNVRVHHPTVTNPHEATVLLHGPALWVTAEGFGEYAQSHASSIHTAGRIVNTLRVTALSAQHDAKYNLKRLPEPLRDALSKLRFRCTEVPWRYDIFAPDLAQVLANHRISLIEYTKGFGPRSYDLLHDYMIEVCGLIEIFRPSPRYGGGGDSAGGSA